MSSDRPKYITVTGRTDARLYDDGHRTLGLTNGKTYRVHRWEGSLPVIYADDGYESALHRVTWAPADDPKNADLIARLARAEAEVAAVRAELGK